MALGRSRRMPLTSLNSVKNMTRFATAGKITGRGLIFLDLGLRGHSVYNTYNSGGNWQREAFAQTIGFAASFYAGSIAFTFLLGPFGLIVALLVVGVVAVAADNVGRRLGYGVYDAGAWLQKILQPPYVY
jgi:hypothetical protein